jgi:hypothetical protein
MSTNFNKLMSDTKGSFTVEITIIFSVVFLLVTVMVYFFIIMYQYSFIQSVANQAANVGTYSYVNKKAEINAYISKRLDKSILGSVYTYENSVSSKYLTKQLDISIKEKYSFTVGKLFEIFGVPSVIYLKAEAHSPMDSNADFVRNMDIVADIRRCISNSDNKWIGKESSINSVLDKILKKK